MIDTHVHFWNYDAVRDSWITEEMQAIRKDFAPKDLIQPFSDLKIEGCIAVQANQSEAENHFLLSLAEQSELIKGIVGWIDLRILDLEERLHYWSAFKLIKGWRHVLQAENDEFILNPEFIAGLQKLKQFNYTYDLLVYHSQLPSLIKMVDQVPNQAFVLDHCGKPNIKSGEIQEWAANIKTLAQNPNVHCKLSGLLAEADWAKWTENEMFKIFDVIFENFGTERVLYGSDWPVMLISRPYADWFYLVNKYAAQFTTEERTSVFSGNAKRFYQL
ncbi:amidohydrolase [Pedobacter yonginense]|uniref:Amidohydrolase n=2 Tax=Pedobacter yonginense TaxID=651869 RepID=A0A317EWG1_9SPHI|nr:amidohydrolase [Pedobacter yonginense]